MDQPNPTARALLCLEAIQDSPGITAARLATILGVSDRAARRYVAVLRDAGLPVESVRGPYGGYRVGRGMRLPPLMFTTAEALGLVMAVLDGHHDVTDGKDPVGSALGKLMRALPATIAGQAEAVRRNATVAPDRAAARPDPRTAMTLAQACADHKQVQLAYRSEAGSQWSMLVDPLAVVVRHGRWYLLCFSHHSQANRTYRIDRVAAVEILGGSFTPPVNLDPVTELEASMAMGWEYEVDVRIQAPLEAARRRLPPSLGKLEALDDGTTRLTGSTGNPSWYVERLAAVPVPYRIIGCDEVRSAAATLGRRMLAASLAADGDATEAIYGER